MKDSNVRRRRRFIFSHIRKPLFQKLLQARLLRRQPSQGSAFEDDDDEDFFVATAEDVAAWQAGLAPPPRPRHRELRYADGGSYRGETLGPGSATAPARSRAPTGTGTKGAGGWG